MDNAKNLEYYKNNLESHSSDLMKLVIGLTQEECLNTNSRAYLTPCTIWRIIKYFLVGESYDLSATKIKLDFQEDLNFNLDNGILNELCEELEDLIDSNYVQNCKLREALKRALKLCECLAEAIKQINCNDKCEFLVGKLFCLLVQIILLIIAIIAKIIILLIFCSDCISCNDKKDVKSSFCDCLICDLEKELDQIEELIDELIKLAISFIKCGSKKCKHDDYNECDCKHEEHHECNCKHDKCNECDYCNIDCEKKPCINSCEDSLQEYFDKYKKQDCTKKCNKNY
ncbi:hypothetical protein [Clostridioides sp. ZZV15-6598]|uniref:hypothetical protein n=1 Tax=Clostridioides sp. ZZV15-6598 TaxID=2811501 RepID=UPI001D127D16|nr:hypothetical protein [Clostridioides sp. ZZV15-6598]